MMIYREIKEERERERERERGGVVENGSEQKPGKGTSCFDKSN